MALLAPSLALLQIFCIALFHLTSALQFIALVINFNLYLYIFFVPRVFI